MPERTAHEEQEYDESNQRSAQEASELAKLADHPRYESKFPARRADQKRTDQLFKDVQADVKAEMAGEKDDPFAAAEADYQRRKAEQAGQE